MQNIVGLHEVSPSRFLGRAVATPFQHPPSKLRGCCRHRPSADLHNTKCKANTSARKGAHTRYDRAYSGAYYGTGPYRSNAGSNICTEPSTVDYVNLDCIEFLHFFSYTEVKADLEQHLNGYSEFMTTSLFRSVVFDRYSYHKYPSESYAK